MNPTIRAEKDSVGRVHVVSTKWNSLLYLPKINKVSNDFVYHKMAFLCCPEKD